MSLQHFTPVDQSRLGDLDRIENLGSLRRALASAMMALESAGYTLDAYCSLGEEERDAPAWRAVRQAWEATGKGPKYVLHLSRGSRSGVRAFATRQEALEAAIEALEMCEAYPDRIEYEGGARLMDRAAILRAWEERHDPG